MGGGSSSDVFTLPTNPFESTYRHSQLHSSLPKRMRIKGLERVLTVFFLKHSVLGLLVISGSLIAMMTYFMGNLLFSQSSNRLLLPQLLLPCTMALVASILLWLVNTLGNQGLYYHKHPEKSTSFPSRRVLLLYIIINTILILLMSFSLALVIFILQTHDSSSEGFSSPYEKFIADTFNIFFFTISTDGILFDPFCFT